MAEAQELVKSLIDSGIHFGHRASNWNPKMKPYIFGRRNLIHVINVKETLRGILAARKFLERIVAGGKDILFVGTKRQARKAVSEQAASLDMHWVTDRWLGGTMTNFMEIRRRISRLEELEQMEAEGTLDAYSKKQGAKLRRELRKIQRNLGGIRKMTKLPGALVVIDQRREIIGIREARKLGIPVICLIDTDSDPDFVDIAIPGNDDAMRAISIVLGSLASAITNGKSSRKDFSKEDEGDGPKRRSRRDTTARAEDAPAGDAVPAVTEAAVEAAVAAATETEAPAAVETPAAVEVAPEATETPAPVEAAAPKAAPEAPATDATDAPAPEAPKSE